MKCIYPLYGIYEDGRLTAVRGQDDDEFFVSIGSDSNTDVVVADSRGANIRAQTGLVNQKTARSWYDWMNAILGRHARLVQNASVSQNKTGDVLARLESTRRGPGFGIPGTDVTGVATWAPVDAGLSGFVAANWFIKLGVNDTDLEEFKRNAVKLIMFAKSRGAQVIAWAEECPLGAAAASFSPAKSGLILAQNAFLRMLANVIPGFYVVPLVEAMVEANTYTDVRSRVEYFSDGLHGNNRGARVEGAAWAAALGKVLLSNPSPLPCSDMEYIGHNSQIRQLVQYPLMSRASVAANAVVPVDNGGTGVSTAESMVAHPDGFGQLVNADVTYAAAGNSRQYNCNQVGAAALADGNVEGKRVYATCEVFVTGPGGAELAAADNLRTVKLRLRFKDGQGNDFEAVDQGESAGDIAMVGSYRRTLRTPAILVQNLAGATQFLPIVQVVANGAGAARVRFGRVAIREEETPVSLLA